MVDADDVSRCGQEMTATLEALGIPNSTRRGGC